MRGVDVRFLREVFNLSEYAPQRLLIFRACSEDVGLPVSGVASEKLDVDFVVSLS